MKFRSARLIFKRESTNRQRQKVVNRQLCCCLCCCFLRGCRDLQKFMNFRTVNISNNGKERKNFPVNSWKRASIARLLFETVDSGIVKRIEQCKIDWSIFISAMLSYLKPIEGKVSHIKASFIVRFH